MGLGFFLVHLEGCSYGVVKPDATLLACSFDAVLNRLVKRGTHLANFSNESNGLLIAQTFYDVIYGDVCDKELLLGLSVCEFHNIISQNEIQWAPDGDAAFDDSSYILQFDLENKVRLISFKVNESREISRDSLRDYSLNADDYYEVLKEWSSAFYAEWEIQSKILNRV